MVERYSLGKCTDILRPEGLLSPQYSYGSYLTEELTPTGPMLGFPCYFRYDHLDFDIAKVHHYSGKVCDWHTRCSSDQAKEVDCVETHRWVILVEIHDLVQVEIYAVVVFQAVTEKRHSLQLEDLGDGLYLLAGPKSTAT